MDLSGECYAPAALPPFHWIGGWVKKDLLPQLGFKLGSSSAYCKGSFVGCEDKGGTYVEDVTGQSAEEKA